MISVQAYLMRLFLRLTLKRKQADSIEKMRAMVDNITTKIHPAVTVETTIVNDVPARLVLPPRARRKSAILYLHGGAYVSGSFESHGGFVSHLAYESRIPVLFVDYRLAPEHPYPAALDDAISAYKWLLNEHYPPENILIAGDSAGGGLTLATLLRLRDDHMALPAGAMCISPWTDLLATGSTITTHARKDPWLKAKGMALPVGAYVQDEKADHPYISPLYGDFAGLPPLLIQVGDHEILLSDAERVAEKARSAGVTVDLQVWKGMWHVWHAFYAFVPESRRAIREMASFAKDHAGNRYLTSQTTMEPLTELNAV